MDSRTTWALDSGFLSYLDSGFYCLDSGFQDSGFRIPKPTKSRIPDYLTRGETFFECECSLNEYNNALSATQTHTFTPLECFPLHGMPPKLV
jgi:hypothetical protein